MVRPAPHPRKYEMMIVVAPTVTEDGLSTVVERVSGYVENHGGSVESFTHDNPWGRRRLAYPIQNFRDAFYVLYYFHGSPRAIDEIDRDIRLDEVIIRHLIVRYDPLTEKVQDEDTPEETGEPAPAVVEAAVAEEPQASGADDGNEGGDDAPADGDDSDNSSDGEDENVDA